MRFVIYIAAMILTLSMTAQVCPVTGEGRNDKEKELNREKNRTCILLGDDVDRIDTISLTRILNPGFISAENVPFTTNKLICTVGYVTMVKLGGSESCNCHSKDKEKMDIHLELGISPNSHGIDCMVVEATPKYPNRSSIDWKSLVGKKVMVTGYLFSDIEHYYNAVNTNPKGTDLWRRTLLELHPLINIIVLD